MRSQQGLYLLPTQAHQFVRAQKGKVLFVDVRTRAEAQFLGMATPVDALVPYVEFQDFMTDWDETKGFYKLEPFSDFVPEIGRRLQAKGFEQERSGGADLQVRRAQFTCRQLARRLGLHARLHRGVWI